jgi:hypothetical protein
MPGRLPEQKRKNIAKDIQQGMSCNGAAKKHSVSPGTVQNIAREIGHSFERTATENATRAKMADMKAMRAELAEMMLEAARDALHELKDEYVVHHFTKEGDFVKAKLDKPPASDKRNLMVVAATAIDKTIVIDRHDNGDDSADQAKAMLGKLGDMIFGNAVPRPKVTDGESD